MNNIDRNIGLCKMKKNFKKHNRQHKPCCVLNKRKITKHGEEQKLIWILEIDNKV